MRQNYEDHLDDFVIDLAVTPNRGDCLSVRGIAREVAALTKTALKQKPISVCKPNLKDKLSVKLEAKEACPHYVGRIIKNIKADAKTPTWLIERLRLSGVRAISPVVDVTNYVMLELGQPMHAFDLNTIKKEIIVRYAKANEKIILLDASEKTLTPETMIIADQETPLAIAGVMGGLNSSVTLSTKDIFLESAYFSELVVAKQRQYYHLHSESAYRFERGIDPSIQIEAIERATGLILEIAGGEAGEITEVKNEAFLPKSTTIQLSKDKIDAVLGVNILEKEIDAIFKALQFEVSKKEKTWFVKTPPYRFDLKLPEDLIEEIARLYGYDRIPVHPLYANLTPDQVPEAALDLDPLRALFNAKDFNEIISYSFVDEALQYKLNPSISPQQLLNPITNEMAVMRTTLWPGLIMALLYNHSRQQERIRLFEIGTCFLPEGEEQKVAGLLMGETFPPQWGLPKEEVDFFVLKGVLENALDLSAWQPELIFKPVTHEALHPGQSAGIYKGDKLLGVLGALHPSLGQALKLPRKVFLFELDTKLFKKSHEITVKEVSKFPEIRRDLAILINQAIPAQVIQDTIKANAGDWLKESFIFDVYQGKGISAGQKSIALALILQHPTRTLVEDEVAALMDRVIKALKGQLGAELRS